MRFRIGSIPEEFEPDASWSAIREPGPFAIQFIATPVAIVTGLGFLSMWKRFVALPQLSVSSEHAPWFLIAVVLSFPLLIVVHELLHAVAHPSFGIRHESVIGAWPSRMLFYAHYSGPMSRDRFLLIFAFPFLFISVLPLCLGVLGLLPASFVPVAAWFSAWNAFFACGDIIGFFLILFQIPRKALVQNRGWKTYWKPASL